VADKGKQGLGDYARQFFTNWNEYQGPVGRRLWLTALNRSRALAGTVGPPFSGCCQRHGEPGC